MFVPRRIDIRALKKQLGTEFGFETDQLSIYCRYKLVHDGSYLLDVQDFDPDEDILLCISLGNATVQPDDIVRLPT